MAFIYLASPYSSPRETTDPPLTSDYMELRYKETLKVVTYLIKNDYPIYSPIVHCHHIARIGELPVDAKSWERYNFRMLSVASGLLILKLPGWMNSKGVRAERSYAKTHYIPVSHLAPEDIYTKLPSAIDYMRFPK